MLSSACAQIRRLSCNILEKRAGIVSYEGSVDTLFQLEHEWILGA